MPGRAAPGKQVEKAGLEATAWPCKFWQSSGGSVGWPHTTQTVPRATSSPLTTAQAVAWPRPWAPGEQGPRAPYVDAGCQCWGTLQQKTAENMQAREAAAWPCKCRWKFLSGRPEGVSLRKQCNRQLTASPLKAAQTVARWCPSAGDRSALRAAMDWVHGARQRQASKCCARDASCRAGGRM